MSTAYCLVFCTCPDADSAGTLADALVAERLAACVNILPGLVSVYTWEGKTERASEHLLVIKTEAALYPALETFIQSRHPYDVPEIVALPVARGSAPYLHWISTCLHPPEEP
ncbi:divalent-cation tolerance protein CutA [Methylomagnum ishizawai]|uniref:divalent-cation tolerance protein CutA n=1 Tax=Methylomagnum ishizawai TaxID=1760988 RepID=UPI001C331AA2|nr:divalent-cation tolerance protein CutA [Methylomagnum ishizawai]BBL73869.1 hypothetical protein MishRS11D_09670 [Methylomagnum ishizawai]